MLLESGKKKRREKKEPKWNSPWRITYFAEKGVERVVTATNGLVRGHLTIRLDTVFQAVQFPAGIT